MLRGLVPCLFARFCKMAYFRPEDITALTTALEDTLSALRLVDRNDPTVTMVAKRIIELAKHGERNPTRLRNFVVSQFQARSRYD
jgi:hypothetical protein